MTDSKLSKVETLEDVTDDDLQQTIDLCKRDGGTATTKKQDNGLWTVTCTYPSQPATSKK